MLKMFPFHRFYRFHADPQKSRVFCEDLTDNGFVFSQCNIEGKFIKMFPSFQANGIYYSVGIDLQVKLALTDQTGWKNTRQGVQGMHTEQSHWCNRRVCNVHTQNTVIGAID